MIKGTALYIVSGDLIKEGEKGETWFSISLRALMLDMDADGTDT